MALPRSWAGVTAALLLAVTLSTTAAQAQTSEPSDADRAAARQMGEDAVAAYNAGEYEKAYDLFKRAHAIVGLTTTGLYLARCLVKLGRFVEASERYVEVTRMKLDADALSIHHDAKATAKEERAELLPRIPKLTVSLADPEAEGITVTLDGDEIPPALLGVARPVDPGDHELVATRGEQKKTLDIGLAEGQTRSVTVDFGAAPPEPLPDPDPPAVEASSTSPLPILGWVAVGVGGAGLVVGAVTGGLAIDKRGTLEDACPAMQCTPDHHDDVDAYQTLRIVSGVSLIAGGVIAATGIVLVAVSSASDDDDTEPAATLTVTPTGVTLSGRF